MRKIILSGFFVVCLLLGGCVSQEYVEYLKQRTDVNTENVNSVRDEVQRHYAEDHQSERKVPVLVEQPDEPERSPGWLVKGIRYVASIGGLVHPAVGVGCEWLLAALPFLFGRKEECA